MFTTRESVFLSMECRTLLNTNERVYIGLQISLRKAKFKSLHVASFYSFTCNRMNARGSSLLASPRGTGPQWDVPQLASMSKHIAQYVFLSLDVV